MMSTLKITSEQIADIRLDLERRHPFAFERVGFIFAGCSFIGSELVLLCRDYAPVADEDYLNDLSAGAVIGPDAMRKSLQTAYRTKSAILHVHSHGGRGRPSFSRTDLDSGKDFVPSFFNVVPTMPHGLIVLSDEAATGLLWVHPQKPPEYIKQFTQVGKSYQKWSS